MKNVMVKAWEIAYEGQKKFGGKVSEYFAKALKMAWAIIKGGKEIMNKAIDFIINEGSNRNKTWIAEIVDTHPIYNLDRDFLDGYENEDEGTVEFRLKEGRYYEICERGERKFVKVTNGEVEEVEYDEVKHYAYEIHLEAKIDSETVQKVIDLTYKLNDFAKENPGVVKEDNVRLIFGAWIEKGKEMTYAEFYQTKNNLKNYLADTKGR